MLRETWSKLASFSVSCCSSHHHVFSSQAMGTILVSPATTKGLHGVTQVNCGGNLSRVTSKVLLKSEAMHMTLDSIQKVLLQLISVYMSHVQTKNVHNIFGHKSWCFRLKLCIFIGHIIIIFIYHLWLWEYTAISVGVLMENWCLTVIGAKHLFRKLVSTQW